MSAGFATVMPTCTLLTAEEGCSTDNACKYCLDVADVVFASDHKYVPGDAIGNFDAPFDADGADALDASSDAPDDHD